MNVYDFTVRSWDGEQVPLSRYRGKVLLIVNTATASVFSYQYGALQELYLEHRGDGLEVLDFPCNQFGTLANGSDDAIHDYCRGRYAIAFPQFARVEVVGEHQIPLYKWLEENSRFAGFRGVMGNFVEKRAAAMDADFRNNSKVKWNFTKFLIDRKGDLAARIEPTAKMSELRQQVEALL